MATTTADETHLNTDVDQPDFSQPSPRIPVNQPFIIRVASNAPIPYFKKIVIDPQVDLQDIHTFGQRAWKALHNTITAPEQVIFVDVDDEVLDLSNPTNMHLLSTMAQQELAFCHSYPILRLWDPADNLVEWHHHRTGLRPSVPPATAAAAVIAESPVHYPPPPNAVATARTHGQLKDAAAMVQEQRQGRAKPVPAGIRVSAPPVLETMFPAAPHAGAVTDMYKAKLMNGYASNPQMRSTEDIHGSSPGKRDSLSVADRTESQKSEAEEMHDCLWWLPSNHPIVRVVESMTMLIIVLSVVAFIIETIPEYRLGPDGKDRTDDHPTFYAIEAFCISWFTIEYAMRFYVAPKKWPFVKAPLNIVDLIAILPFYIGLAVGGSGASSLAVIRILRLSRVMRMFKFSRHSEGLQDMIACMSKTSKELVLFLLIIIVTITLFGSAVYFAERDFDDTDFISIPMSMWWAIVTITTVGYGDVFPKTIQGRLIGSISAALGVVLLAIPASIFISEFMRLHAEKKKMRQATLPSMDAAILALEISQDNIMDALQDLKLAWDVEKKAMKDGSWTENMGEVNSDPSRFSDQPRPTYIQPGGRFVAGVYAY